MSLSNPNAWVGQFETHVALWFPSYININLSASLILSIGTILVISVPGPVPHQLAWLFPIDEHLSRI